MLIYNFQKEFFGIDAADLETLGYSDLSALRAQVTDIADLFVKTPGYIHNFKHVHWIDFVACSDASEIQKVIIYANGKHFRATVSVTNAYLIENASAKAYLVYLNNLQQLSDSEINNLENDLPNEISPSVSLQPPLHEQKEITPLVHHEPKPKIKQEIPPTVKEQAILEVTPTPVPEISKELPTLSDEIQTRDDNFKIDIDLEEAPLQTTPEPESIKPTKSLGHKEKFDNGYIYDPSLASKELGLPIDLIEEFIQDFIAQADDFKPDLYSSLEDGDVDNVKSLSHKLKGVAANLRIEDAFETLSIINTTSDIEVIKTNLDLFYKIMAKLAGQESEEVIDEPEQELILEDTIEENVTQVTETAENDTPLDMDDDFTLDFKEDDTSIPEPEHKKDFDEVDELSLEFKDDSVTTPEIESQPEPEIKPETETIEIPSEPEVEPEVEVEVEVLYSKTKIANEIGLDQESFNELFNDYIEESFSILNKIKTSVENDNLNEIKSEASKLRGMSDNMRVHDFNEELQRLMLASKHQERTKAIQKIEAIMKKLSEQGE